MKVHGLALGLDEATLRPPADLLPAWQELVEVAFQRAKNQTYVFESPVPQGNKTHRRGAHQPLSPMALVMLMRRLRAGVTTHGMRSRLEVAEQSLAHAVGNAVVQAYQRSSMLGRRGL
jgi:hypothetical protein